MLLKKISVKDVVGDVKTIAKAHVDGARVDLLKAYGKAKGYKTDTGTYGVWVAFLGTFGCVNMLTGEESQAPKLFVLEPLQSMLLDQLALHEVVDFAYMISLVVDSELPTGYKYVITPITEVKRSDELEYLRLMVTGDAPKALAAPIVGVVEEKKPSVKKK